MSRRALPPVTLTIGGFAFPMRQIELDAITVAIASERMVLKVQLESGAASVAGTGADVRARFDALGKLAHVLHYGTPPTRDSAEDAAWRERHRRPAAPVAEKWTEDGEPVSPETP